MANILVVCTANICRSPVAAALLQQRLQQDGRTDWRVESAGTWANISRGPARYSIQLMAERGIDIRKHVARTVNEQMVAEADLVLCMELGHAEALKIEFPRHRDRIFLLSEMVSKRYSIPDPYGGPLKNYQEMVAEVTRLLDGGFTRIVALAEAKSKSRIPTTLQ
jgi:protein-tyrosine-phosphatase